MSTAMRVKNRMARRKGLGLRAKGIFLLFALGSLLSLSLPVAAQRGGGPQSNAAAHPAIGDAAAIAEGEKLYNETCTACHGKDGTGGELGPPVAAGPEPSRMRGSPPRRNDRSGEGPPDGRGSP